MSVENKSNAAIGVFDSGVGGLTVAREIMRLLPNENIVYFGDTARVPYGSKSQETVIRYSRQIIRFLQTKDVKAIVIACNTASALALDTVSQETDVPIIGVVVPGARAAAQATGNKKIGVVATEATINSEIYTEVIQAEDDRIQVTGKACPLFVPIVEEGFSKHHIAEEIIDYYLDDMKNSNVDTLILGCTHYPLLRNKIREYLGENIHLVNPAYETALDVKRLLEERDLLNTEIPKEENHEFYVSDLADKFKHFANTILPFDIESTKKINIEEY
ncbi:MAG: glutamate racemase [Eubacteriales bacterium]